MKRSNIQWTAKRLCKEMNSGTVNFDNAVQRGLVWDDDKKSLLIHSMVYGYSIPAMYFTKESSTFVDDNGKEKTSYIYDSLDGKQRSNAIYGYMEGEYCLSENTPPVYDEEGNEHDISGMYFSDLPDWAQDEIKDYPLTIYFYEEMTEAEIREFFRRLNNGKPLTAIELTRVTATSISLFQQIAEHPAVQKVVTEKGKARFTDEQIAMQITCMATESDPDFSTKVFRDWSKNYTFDEEGKTFADILAALDVMQNFINILENNIYVSANKKVCSNIKKRTHFVSATVLCYAALKHGIDNKEIQYILKEFFNGKPTISDEYNKTIGSGSAKPAAVQARKRSIISMVDVSFRKLKEQEEKSKEQEKQEEEFEDMPF